MILPGLVNSAPGRGGCSPHPAAPSVPRIPAGRRFGSQRGPDVVWASNRDSPSGAGHGAAPSRAGRGVGVGLRPFLMTIVTFLKTVHPHELRAVGTPNKMSRRVSVRPAFLAGRDGAGRDGDYSSRHASGRHGASRPAPRPEVPAAACPGRPGPARRGGPDGGGGGPAGLRVQPGVRGPLRLPLQSAQTGQRCAGGGRGKAGGGC